MPSGTDRLRALVAAQLNQIETMPGLAGDPALARTERGQCGAARAVSRAARAVSGASGRLSRGHVGGRGDRRRRSRPGTRRSSSSRWCRAPPFAGASARGASRSRPRASGFWTSSWHCLHAGRDRDDGTTDCRWSGGGLRTADGGVRRDGALRGHRHGRGGALRALVQLRRGPRLHHGRHPAVARATPGACPWRSRSWSRRRSSSPPSSGASRRAAPTRCARSAP